MEQRIHRAIYHVIAVYLAETRQTRVQFAEKLGLSTAALYNRMGGKTHWRMSEVVKISEITGASLERLAGFEF